MNKIPTYNRWCLHTFDDRLAQPKKRSWVLSVANIFQNHCDFSWCIPIFIFFQKAASFKLVWFAAKVFLLAIKARKRECYKRQYETALKPHPLQTHPWPISFQAQRSFFRCSSFLYNILPNLVRNWCRLLSKTFKTGFSSLLGIISVQPDTLLEAKEDGTSVIRNHHDTHTLHIALVHRSSLWQHFVKLNYEREHDQVVQHICSYSVVNTYQHLAHVASTDFVFTRAYVRIFDCTNSHITITAT